jgi:Spy/CpxP family protein refolding chaperone
MNRSVAFKIVIAGIVLVSTFGVPALAQDARRGGPPGVAWGRGDGGALGPLGGVLRSLDLSDEQRQQVHAQLTQAMQGELGQSLRRQEDERHALRQLVLDPKSEEAAIVAQVRAVNALAEPVALAQHRLAVSVMELLTPEQREQAKKILEDRAMRRHRPGPPPTSEDPDAHDEPDADSE